MRKECQVCSQPAHGNHFGATTCRACAAFFRRSVVQGRKYKCRKGARNCKVVGNEKFVCRFCRYQKCISLGMTPENVQWNRDVLSTTVERGPSENNEAKIKGTESKKPFIQLNNELRTSIEATSSDILQGDNTRITFDVTYIIERLKNIFSQDQQKSKERCLLLQMYRALERYRSKMNARAEFVDTIDFLHKFSSWKIHLLEIAQWMMNCEYFAALPLEDKETILEGSWMLWKRFERLQMTMHLFGEQAIHERMILSGENATVNMNTVRIEVGSLMDHDPKQIRSMFEECFSRLTEDVATPLLQLNLDNYEVSYVLNALVWHVEGRNVRPSTRTTAEDVLDRISDELHDHYTYDLRMPNYAARLTRIMGIIFSIEKEQYERSIVMDLARVFDVLKFEMSEKGYSIF